MMPLRFAQRVCGLSQMQRSSRISSSLLAEEGKSRKGFESGHERFEPPPSPPLAVSSPRESRVWPLGRDTAAGPEPRFAWTAGLALTPFLTNGLPLILVFPAHNWPMRNGPGNGGVLLADQGHSISRDWLACRWKLVIFGRTPTKALFASDCSIFLLLSTHGETRTLP